MSMTVAIATKLNKNNLSFWGRSPGKESGIKSQILCNQMSFMYASVCVDVKTLWMYACDRESLCGDVCL